MNKFYGRFVEQLSNYRTGIFSHPVMLEHKDVNKYNHLFMSHPEDPSRVDYVMKMLKKNGFLEICEVFEPRKVSKEELELFHSSEYIQLIQSITDPEILSKFQSYSTDTYFCEQTGEAALFSCGSVVAAVEKILVDDMIDNAFIVNRPPGHHALHDEAMGFCIFNNVAVGALVAERYLKSCGIENPKITIIDWDIHHCNGTALLGDMNPNFVIFSTHGNTYPFTGSISKTGKYNNNYNFEFNYSYGSGDIYQCFEEIIYPFLNSDTPDFLFISAGFDCCLGDPIGGCKVNPKIFERIIFEIKSICENIPIIVALEGGYDLENLYIGVEGCIKGLLEENEECVFIEVEKPVDEKRCKKVLEMVKEYHTNIFN